MLKDLLKDKIIDTSKPEWNKKKKNIDNQDVVIPKSLNGEILLEEDTDEKGRIKGWLTISPENLEKVLTDIADPSKPDITEETTGLKKYIDKWENEGIKIKEFSKSIMVTPRLEVGEKEKTEKEGKLRKFFTRILRRKSNV